MRNKFIQTRHGYCTVYALASMLGSEEIVEKFGAMEKFSNGGADDQDERDMVESVQEDLSICPVLDIRHSYGIPLPFDLVDRVLRFDHPKAECDREYFDTAPYLLTVRLRGVKSHHSVVVFNVKGQLWYLDPLWRNWMKIDSMEDLRDEVEEIWAVKSLYQPSTQEFLLISSQYMDYQFNETKPS